MCVVVTVMYCVELNAQKVTFYLFPKRFCDLLWQC
jgi:hypothetical protein